MVYRKKGTVHDWAKGQWKSIGTCGTEGQDAEDPDKDVPESWAFLKSDDILLA